MTDLHDVLTEITDHIAARPMGSGSRFKLRDAANSICRAIRAIEREDLGAQIDGNQPENHTQPSPEGGAQLEGNQA